MQAHILIWVDPYSTPEYCNNPCYIDTKDIKGVFSSIDKLNEYLSQLCKKYGYYDMKDFTTEIMDVDPEKVTS